jgi:hypothetical protein
MLATSVRRCTLPSNSLYSHLLYLRYIGCLQVCVYADLLLVMRLLYHIDQELGSILTAVLTIPLATHIPTPNARKTCALAIWLIQSQRLPEEVLIATKDRVAYALRRAIEGELGKEGKKGSANDGLKVKEAWT